MPRACLFTPDPGRLIRCRRIASDDPPVGIFWRRKLTHCALVRAGLR